MDAVTWDVSASERRPPTVRSLESNLQLFFDDWLIEEMGGVSLRLHHPQPQEVVLELDRPWEGPASGVGLEVLHDEGRYRMWYVGFTEKGQRRTCYAESEDGIRWERPDLGLTDFEGSKSNNLVMEADKGWNLCPFRDGHPAPEYPQPYKAIARLGGKEFGGPALRAYVSDDLISWRTLDRDPILVSPSGFKPAFDSPISAFWDSLRGYYVAYMRGMVAPGLRAIRRSVSTDFRNWSVPEFVDLGDSPSEELYMSACTPYFRAPNIYLSFPNRYAHDRTVYDGAVRKGIAETVFMASRDGTNFSRQFMEAFIRPGPDPKNWHKHSMMVGTGVHPVSPTELALYYVENHGHPSVRIRRATLRTDGFTSVSAPYGGGELVTKPLTFAGDQLVVNFSSSVVGSMRVEVQSYEGHPIEGFGIDDCEEIYGDEIERVVRWKGGSLGMFETQPIRLRFVMTKELDLFSLQFRHTPGVGEDE